MATRRRDPGGSWWWPRSDGGSGEEDQAEGGGEFAFEAMCENERRQREQMAAYQLQEVGMAAAQNINPQEIVDADIFQLSYPRPRLRWTAELHDQFVRAVDELGGASKATPKAIWNLMGVQGLTLYHLKSHLQKFRLGKTGRKLWKKDFIPANYYRKDDRDRLPPMNLEAQAPSFSNVFDRNSVSHEYMGNGLGAEAYGNMHLLVEPQPQPQPQPLPLPAVEKFEMSGLNTFEVAEYSAAAAAATTTITSSSVKLEEEFGAQRPALLPLFPPIPASGMMGYSDDQEWPEYHLEGGGISVGPSLPVENAAVDDDYLNSLGYSSSESCRASMIVGTFFDEVASFSKVDADDLNADPHAGVAHYYP